MAHSFCMFRDMYFFPKWSYGTFWIFCTFVNLLHFFYVRLLTVNLLLKYFILIPYEQLKHLLKGTNEMCLKGWLGELFNVSLFFFTTLAPCDFVLFVTVFAQVESLRAVINWWCSRNITELVCTLVNVMLNSFTIIGYTELLTLCYHHSDLDV